MKKYKDWDLMDTMPEGWHFDRTAGTPLHGYGFATNGLSVLNGGLRALVRVIHPQKELDMVPAPIARPFNEAPKAQKPVVKPDSQRARTVNDLARAQFKHKMLADIRMDLMVCEIEGWNKLEYLNELKSMINSIGANK